jgi:hypothetical protein
MFGVVFVLPFSQEKKKAKGKRKCRETKRKEWEGFNLLGGEESHQSYHQERQGGRFSTELSFLLSSWRTAKIQSQSVTH